MLMIDLLALILINLRHSLIGHSLNTVVRYEHLALFLKSLFSPFVKTTSKTKQSVHILSPSHWQKRPLIGHLLIFIGSALLQVISNAFFVKKSQNKFPLLRHKGHSLNTVTFSSYSFNKVSI